jgi:hypothetical protein
MMTMSPGLPGSPVNFDRGQSVMRTVRGSAHVYFGRAKHMRREICPVLAVGAVTLFGALEASIPDREAKMACVAPTDLNRFDLPLPRTARRLAFHNLITVVERATSNVLCMKIRPEAKGRVGMSPAGGVTIGRRSNRVKICNSVADGAI